MSAVTTNLPPLRSETPLSEDGKITVEAHRALLQLYNAHPTIQLSTASGPANFPVPYAKLNQNVEITYIKTSADANAPTLTASGTDKINGLASVALGTAQYARVRLKSDGRSNWFIVG